MDGWECFALADDLDLSQVRYCSLFGEASISVWRIHGYFLTLSHSLRFTTGNSVWDKEEKILIFITRDEVVTELCGAIGNFSLSRQELFAETSIMSNVMVCFSAIEIYSFLILRRCWRSQIC